MERKERRVVKGTKSSERNEKSLAETCETSDALGYAKRWRSRCELQNIIYTKSRVGKK
jgi:hypothetical protein